MRAFIAPLPMLAARFARSVSTASHAPLPATRRNPSFRTSFAGRALLSAAAAAAAAAALLPLAACNPSRSEHDSDPTQCRASTSTSASTPPSTPAMSLADLPTLTAIDGTSIPPDVFSGKVVFAINVASACGYTSSGYDLLKLLVEKYPATDFVAVAIPCNAFGSQESGPPDQIEAFARQRVGDGLVITQRAQVNGHDAHPIFKVAARAFPADVSWNFDGRLVFDRDGKPVARFGNSAGVKEIVEEIEKVI